MEEQRNPKGAGRKKKIPSQERLLEIFEEFRTEVKQNPISVTDWVGKDAIKVDRKKERPLTMVAFEAFCYRKGYIKDLKDYFANDNGRYDEYQPTCRYILASMEADRIEGGMAGIYNSSLTARLNGLPEKTQNENNNINRVINVQVVGGGPPLSDSEKNIDLE